MGQPESGSEASPSGVSGCWNWAGGSREAWYSRRVLPQLSETQVKAPPVKPSPGTYMRQIDGLRALAVSGVLFHHFVMGRIELGTVGVILFFVISGFLI